MNASLVLVLLSTTSGSSSAMVTMPLSEAMPLLQPAVVKVSRPPVDAVLVHQALKGRPQQDGLGVEARFEVQVLADQTWVQLPLLPLGADTVVQQVDVGEGATVAARDGQLAFFSAKAGAYTVQVRLLVRARVEGLVRSAVFAAGTGVVPLTLEADPGIFELEGSDELFAVKGQYAVRWKARAQVVKNEKREPPPPLEPRVTQVAATWVTTLEGKVTSRLSYRLQLDRPQPFEVTIPEGQQLESVRVNGQVQTVAAKDGVVKLEVAPVRLGETEGKVELRLAQDIGVFHLAGALRVALPQSSWQTDAVSLVTYLPAVFEYRRVGGSLEEGEIGEPAGLPGRALGFRQFLVVASSPSVELRYSVDISKSYFR